VHAELEAWSHRERLPRPQEVAAARARYLRSLKILGIPADRLSPSVERVIQALTRVLADERGRWIFDATHRDVSSELALTGVSGQQIVNIVVDRTFTDRSGVRWIVDFKTSTHQGTDVEAFLDREVIRYRAQMELYARLIGPQDDLPLRIGLYFPLLGGWREWTVANPVTP
jgi:ATP-dependent helicase/nuclease subunit A